MKIIVLPLLGALGFLAGCAVPPPLLPPRMEVPGKPTAADKGSVGNPRSDALVTRVTETPKPPLAEGQAPRQPQPPGAPEEATITFAFEQIPLASFVQAVYGASLKRNVNVDPAVVARQDLITIRTGTPQTPSQVADAARLLLKSYGIAVIDLGSIVRIVPDTANVGYLPEIRRGRALPDTPLPLRPIFQLVELQVVRNPEVAQWIKTLFGAKVNMLEDPGRNAIWLSGQPDDVAAAMEALKVLDQPLMKGRHSLRITPVYMTVDEMSQRLSQVLLAQGYSSGPPTPGSSSPITLVPIQAVNALFVFATDPTVAAYVTAWAKELDQPQTRGVGRSFFSYQVRYSDAQSVAGTLERILGGAAAPRAGTGAAPGGAAAPAALGRVVVDQSSNTVIFQGTSEDYVQIRGILELIDRPAKQALIEVTVAEVALTENSQLGVEWLVEKVNLGGVVTSYGTLGGLGIGSSGFNLSRIDSAAGRKLLLNALASDNRSTILSSPRVVARNGESATIQVGQEVPIITSQQTSPTTGSTGAVLQTVQYRSAGVILRVRPVIHSGNQIDLEISQEVSAAQSTTTGVSTSPTFGTRKIDTKLSLREGSTVLLGGLISNNSSMGNAGIPFLKNIPLVGHAFRTDTTKRDRTELIILITPYIIASDNDAQAVTEAFRSQLGDWARGSPGKGGPDSGTATPAPSANVPVKP